VYKVNLETSVYSKVTATEEIVTLSMHSVSTISLLLVLHSIFPCVLCNNGFVTEWERGTRAFSDLIF
jgi:hypothetical protein